MNLLGLHYNEVEVTYTAGLAVVPPRHQSRLRADRQERPGHARAERQVSKMDTLQSSTSPARSSTPTCNDARALCRREDRVSHGRPQHPNPRPARARRSAARHAAAARVLQMPPLRSPRPTEQLGLDPPGFLSCRWRPWSFAKPRRHGGWRVKLLHLRRCRRNQVTQLQLSSAQSLFSMACGVVVAGKLFLIEAVSTSEAREPPICSRCCYRKHPARMAVGLRSKRAHGRNTYALAPL